MESPDNAESEAVENTAEQMPSDLFMVRLDLCACTPLMPLTEHLIYILLLACGKSGRFILCSNLFCVTSIGSKGDSKAPCSVMSSPAYP